MKKGNNYGFRGYLGGFEAIWVISDNELASTSESRMMRPLRFDGV